MIAIRLHERNSPSGLLYEDAPQPKPTTGEVLIRVYATGITPTELSWSTTWKTSTGIDRPVPIPGHDLSGVVAEVGTDVMDIRVGMAVYAPLTAFDRDGAEADYAIALPSEVAPKPHSLDHVQAAAVPLSALTAWQALFDHASLSPGNRVLIYGTAGGVGTLGVQLARWAGAYVIGTASRHNQVLHHARDSQVTQQVHPNTKQPGHPSNRLSRWPWAPAAVFGSHLKDRSFWRWCSMGSKAASRCVRRRGQPEMACRLANRLTTRVIIHCHSRAHRKSRQCRCIETVERVSLNVWRERLL